MLSQASLRNAASPEEFVQRVAAAAKALDEGTVTGGRELGPGSRGRRMPDRHWIDAVTLDTPVAVIRYDLRMLLFNSLALKLAGIDHNTPEVPGGTTGPLSLSGREYSRLPDKADPAQRGNGVFRLELEAD